MSAARLWRSHAKINLHLQVVGRRADGYHELRTVFQTVSLHDELELGLTADGAISLTVEGADLPADERNLAWRAARIFLDRWGRGHGVRMRLRKRVPLGGGMGGGSANAATVLRALADELGTPPGGELMSVARALGADVPYFLVGGTAVGFGRGDEVLPVAELPATELWLAIPPVAVSTPAAFAAAAPPTSEPLVAPLLGALAAGQPLDRALLRAGRNDLEPAVLKGWPAVAEVYDSLTHSGADVVRLSGSGATVWAIFEESPDVARLTARLPPGCRLERVETLDRERLWRHRPAPRGAPAG